MHSELNRAFEDKLRSQRVVPVLTIADPTQGVRLARALAEGGLPVVEVTLRTPSAIEAIRALAGIEGIVVGAGTVLTPEQARQAIAAGARFIVSPGAAPRLVAAARDWPVPWLPGAATASEAMALAHEGYRVLKFFPSEAAGGVAALKALAAPLPEVVFCPTGGIDAAKAPAYLALANVCAVGGSWVAPEGLVAAGDWAAVTALARAAASSLPVRAATAAATPMPGGDGGTAQVRVNGVEIGSTSEESCEVASQSPAEVEAPAEADATKDAGGEAGASTLSHRVRRHFERLEPFSNEVANLTELYEHPDFCAVVDLLADPGAPLVQVIDYACGVKWALACAGLKALARRSDSAEALHPIAERLADAPAWTMQTAVPLIAEGDAKLLDVVLAGARDWWGENTVMTLALTSYFERLGPRVPEEHGPCVRHLSPAGQDRVKQLLGRIRHPAAERLASRLKSLPPTDPTGAQQRSVLETVGRFWRDEREPPQLFEPADWKDALAQAATAIERKPARSILISGEGMTGKSSFLRLLAERMGARGWTVYEAGGSDLQAGQQYIGQLEGRIRALIDEIAQSTSRILWYVPDLLQLALSGTHLGQSASILDQILPAVSDGRLLILAEATPASTARLLQMRPKLRRVLEVVRLEPLGFDATVAIADKLARALAARSRLAAESDVAAAATDAAEHYFGSQTLPGSALSLLRLTALRVESAGKRALGAHDALETLAQLTGLPLSILDGSERLDLGRVRAFLETRVIGQPEAVTSVVERIAMLKSGLNDPMKPIAVFLLAGPTGTGKTELAKAIAEYLFGSVERMIRLDMSEYQSPESIQKITGGPAMPPDADTLIAKIRKQPFSLILLDEFEKSSPAVWDIFLQVFDEGRLTDTAGQTADFRHCLIILTTNLGATRHQSSGLGFAPSRGVYTNDQVLAAIGQTFRPEFQNRLDKVIVFQPLTRDLMRGILKKELDRLFERRGLKDRDWAVEWEASALEFLLEKGFSPEMGARPLKRAIDQYVVAPLAATIVERRFPEGDQFVFIKSDGAQIRAEFVDPDGDGEPVLAGAMQQGAPPAGQAPTLAAMILSPRGSDGEIATLETAAEEIAQRVASADWDTEKARLAAEMSRQDFWTRADRFEALSRYALMDRLAMAADTAASLQTRLERRKGRSEQGARELVARLALQLHLVREGLADLDGGAPVEVALAVEPAFDGTPDRKAGGEWCLRILDMYRGWARRRHMQTTELDRVGSGAIAPVLLVSGFGAYRKLAREAGLHVHEGEGLAGRAAARVMLVPLPPGDTPKGRLRTIVAAALTELPRTTTVVRRYRTGASPLVRNAEGTWRSGKLDAVLAGDFDLMAGEG